MPPDNAVGGWSGTVNFDGAGARTFTGVVLYDGQYWFQYSLVGDPSTLGGMVAGTGAGAHGVFTSTDGSDYALDRIFSSGVFTLSGTYVPRSGFGGNLDFGLAGMSPYATTYDAGFDRVPTLAAVAGHYSLTGITVAAGLLGNAFVSTADVTIAADGSVLGTLRVPVASNSCDLTGIVATRSEGAVYDITISTGPPFGLCGISTTFQGIMTLDASGFARFSLHNLNVNNPYPNIGVALTGVRS